MGRAPCCDNKSGLKKGPWTPEEDVKLTDYIEAHGPGNWRALPKKAGLERCGKSCRLRWTNYLRPDIKRGRFSFEEEEAIIHLHSTLGNKWSAIAASLPGRTDNEIKNFWNTHIKKRLLRNGIDPVTHAPRLDLSSILTSSTNLLNLSSLLNAQTLMNPEMLRLASTLLLLKQGNGDLFSQIGTENPVSDFQNPNSFNIGQISSSPGYNNNFANFGIQNLTAENNFNPAVTIPLENNTNFELPKYSNDEMKFTRVNDNSVIWTPNNLCNGGDLSSSSSAFMNNGTTEDDRDSYCSNFLELEIPEGLDFSDFM